jgi:hypothetical protein
LGSGAPREELCSVVGKRRGSGDRAALERGGIRCAALPPGIPCRYCPAPLQVSLLRLASETFSPFLVTSLLAKLSWWPCPKLTLPASQANSSPDRTPGPRGLKQDPNSPPWVAPLLDSAATQVPADVYQGAGCRCGGCREIATTGQGNAGGLRTEGLLWSWECFNALLLAGIFRWHLNFQRRKQVEDWPILHPEMERCLGPW